MRPSLTAGYFTTIAWWEVKSTRPKTQGWQNHGGNQEQLHYGPLANMYQQVPLYQGADIFGRVQSQQREFWDDNGEYHLYPVIEEDKEAQQNVNKLFGTALGALCANQACLINVIMVEQRRPSQILEERKENKVPPTAEPDKNISSTQTAQNKGLYRANTVKITQERTEELKILKITKPTSYNAKIVVEPDSLMEFTTSIVQFAEPLAEVRSNPCVQRISNGSGKTSRTSSKFTLVRRVKVESNPPLSDESKTVSRNKETYDQSEEIILLRENKNLSLLAYSGPCLKSTGDCSSDSAYDSSEDDDVNDKFSNFLFLFLMIFEHSF